MDSGTPRRRLDLGLGRLGAAIGDVVADRIVEQHGILRHDPDGAAQAILRHLGDILAVDGHGTALHIIEAIEDAAERRFAGAGMADDGELGTRRHIEGHVAEDLAALVIAEIDMREAHMRAADGQRRSPGHIGDLGRRVDQAEHRFHVDQALLDLAIDHAEHVQRPEQLRQQRVDQHHIADGEPALMPAPDSIAHRRRHHDVGNQRLADIEQRQRIFRLGRGIGIAFDGKPIVTIFMGFGVEIFYRFVIQ